MAQYKANIFESLAKSKELGGQTIYEHTQDLVLVFGYLVKSNSNFIFKMNRHVFLNEIKDFTELLIETIKHHDDGKAYPEWQKWAKNPTKIKMMRHEFISALLYKKELINEQLLAILCHHGNFVDDKEGGYYNEKIKYANYQNLKCIDFLKEFRTISKKILDESGNISILHNIPEINTAFIRFNSLRTYLQLCDKMASFLESQKNEYREDFHIYLEKIFQKYNMTKIEKEIAEQKYTLRPIQQQINSHNPGLITIIRGVPGSGKSLAAALWASKIIKENRADKLIVAMPTKFTTNQAYLYYKKLLNLPTSRYHGDIRMDVKIQNKNVIDKYDRSENLFNYFLNESMCYPVSIRTIDSVVSPFRLLTEEHNIRVTALQNSCLIIDEIDFYNTYTLAAIHFLLEKCRDWKVPILVMSASFPKSHFSFYKNIYGDEFDESRDYIQDKSYNTIPKVKIGEIKEYFRSTKNKKSGLDKILHILNKATKQDTIIYANTSRSCYEYYNYFINTLKLPKKQVVLYNSLFKPEDRQRKEQQIMELLGENKIERSHPIIVIMTQVGEMSLNISCDFMISEICPMNALYQRIGRLKRFSKEVGTLDILIPLSFQKNKNTNKSHKSPFPFPYVFDSSVLDSSSKSELLSIQEFTKTLNIIKKKGENKIYTYKELDNLVDWVFNENISYETFHQNAKENTEILYTNFNTNFLICSRHHKQKELTENQSEEEQFNIRGIRNVHDVFIQMNEKYEEKFMFDLDYYKNGILSVMNNVADNQIFENKIIKYPKKNKLYNNNDTNDINFTECNLKVLKNPNLYNSETGLNEALYNPDIFKKYSDKK